MTTHADALGPLVQAIASRTAEIILERLGADQTIDQRSSPAGSRRFIAAARAGELKAVRIGRRWVASKADHDEWLERVAVQGGLGHVANARRTAAEKLEAELRGQR